MTKREAVFQLIKVAGYHGDSRTATRLLVENPVSRKAYNDAWFAGVDAKRTGQKCSCHQCQKEGK